MPAGAAALIALLGALPAGASAEGRNPQGRILGVVHAGAGPPPNAAARRLSPLTTESPLSWHGGPVVHDGHAYAIFWEPPGYSYPTGYKAAIAKYFDDVATDSGRRSNVYAVSRQYYDSTGPAAYRVAFAGSYTDTSPLPQSDCYDRLASACVSDGALTRELGSFISSRGLPRGLANQYFLFTPPGVGSCYQNPGAPGPDCAFAVWCAYHSWFGSGSSTVLYSIHPFVKDAPNCDVGESPTHSTADAVLNVVSHEHNEIITDPIGDGWYDADGEENGDKCAWTWGNLMGAPGGAYNQLIAGSPYLLQQEWSNHDAGCATTYGVNQRPTALFQRVGGAVAKKAVHFTARASRDPDGSIRSYSWRFGDGRTARGVAPVHTYATAGTYQVKLTVTDDEGATATRTLSVVVQRPPRKRAAGKKHRAPRKSASSF